MIPWGQVASEFASGWIVLALLAGTVLGLLVGALPGIGPVTGISLLLPLSFFLPPLTALLFYTTLYQAAEYGGSITAIAVSVPGTANAAATIADGYAMNRAGWPGKAFAYSLWATVLSSLISMIVVIILTPVLAKYAVYISSSELMGLGILALSTTAVLTADMPTKGLLSMGAGVLAGTIGTDQITGIERFTFGNSSLYDGLPLSAVLIGIFALPEAIFMVSGLRRPGRSEVTAKTGPVPRDRRVWLTWQDVKGVRSELTTGTLIGFFAGVIPGLAASVPSWVSYNVAKLRAKNGAEYGRGAPGGIVAPEATNGAGMHSTLVPAFFLGLPGTPTSAIILGAMTIGGLVPGPLLAQQHASLLYGIFFGLLVGAVLLWFVGRVSTFFWVRIAQLRPYMLGTVILVLSVLGVYSSRSNLFDVQVLVVAGIVGLVMYLLDYSRPAFVVGFIISPIVEVNLRRSLIISNDNASFLLNPVVLVLLLLSAAVVAWAISSKRKSARPAATGVGIGNDEAREASLRRSGSGELNGRD